MTATTEPEPEDDKLERAAEEGPLPGVQALDEAERGDDAESEKAEPEEKAQEAAEGDVVGGINMH